MAPISEERSGSVWVDGAAKDGNGSALSILEILNRRLDFSRLRRAEYGVHHRISGKYLYQYANEMAWREDNRRVSNGINFKLVTAAALRHPKSAVWAGYWQRAAA
jgi:hypothetical protein